MKKAGDNMNEKLIVGKIGAPHGIKGEIKVFPLTDDPTRFEALKKVYVKSKDGYEEFKISSVKYSGSHLILKLKEINNRNDADRLKHEYLEISKEDGIPLEEDEYYIVDLIGLDVYEEERKLGVLKDIISTGGTDLYEIQTEEKTILVPAVSQYILNIDMDNRRIEASIPEELKEL